jgi:hypothetical protein
MSQNTTTNAPRGNTESVSLDEYLDLMEVKRFYHKEAFTAPEEDTFTARTSKYSTRR